MSLHHPFWLFFDKAWSFRDCGRRITAVRSPQRLNDAVTRLLFLLANAPTGLCRLPMLTLLFDIDGTLINTMGAGGSALREAFADTFAVHELAEVPFSGRTDRGIIGNLFRLHGIDHSEDNHRQICDAYLGRLPAHLRQKQGTVLAGVASLLKQLDSRPDVQLGLLTGNLETAARIKLEHFDLFDCFGFGGYGDRHADRDDVARAALRAAGMQNSSGGDRLWVIGDTPLDIRCGRAIQARVLAVATGLHPLEELADHAPDVLLDDLSREDDVLEILFSDEMRRE